MRIKNLCLQAQLHEPLIQEKGDFVDVELFRALTEKKEYRQTGSDNGDN